MLSVCFTFCASKEIIQTNFPQEIKAIYFQKGIAGIDKSVQEIHFYIEFKKPLSKELKLEKIYFRNQETKIVKTTPTLYKAIFFQKPFTEDLILDRDVRKEYGNKAPVLGEPKFDLKPNEVLLEFKSKNAIKFFKLTPVKEKK